MASNKQIVYQYLRGKGLSESATAGIMGNIALESNFSTSATNKSSGAYGLFQWLGGRKTGLQEYAKSVGKSAGNIYVQLDYFWKELNSTEKKTLEKMTSGNYSPEEYAKIFEQTFERSGGAGMAKRQQYAKDYYTEYNGSYDESFFTAENTGLSGWVSEKTTDVAKTVVKIIFLLVLVVLGILFMSGAFRG